MKKEQKGGRREMKKRGGRMEKRVEWTRIQRETDKRDNCPRSINEREKEEEERVK